MPASLWQQGTLKRSNGQAKPGELGSDLHIRGLQVIYRPILMELAKLLALCEELPPRHDVNREGSHNADP